MLAALLGPDISFMGELLTWLLAAAVLCLLAGGLVWRRRAGAEREAQRRAATAEAQRLAAERAAAEQARRERVAAAEREAQRQAELLAEQQRLAARQGERERVAAAEAQRDVQRRAAEQAEAQRLAVERAEAERAAAEQAERERAAAAEREAQRQAELLAEEQRLAAEQAPLPHRDVKGAPQTLVLVADDSKVVRIKTGRLLAQHQYQVSYASDGLDAVQQMQAQRPDVVITDVEMPGMDGFELTRHIRGNPQTAQLPVIMITAADDRHREQADSAGVSVLLGKPYSEDALISHIRLAMGQDEAETSLA